MRSAGGPWGRLEGETLTCRAHGWSYDAFSGAGASPAGTALRPLAVKVEDGEILVDIPAAGGPV